MTHQEVTHHSVMVKSFHFWTVAISPSDSDVYLRLSLSYSVLKSDSVLESVGQMERVDGKEGERERGRGRCMSFRVAVVRPVQGH